MSLARRAILPGTAIYGVVLAAALVGLLLVALGVWRVGLGLCGVAFAVGGLGRALLADSAAGLLRVRRRWFDVTWMIALGAALVVLAVIVPRGFAA